MSQPYRFQPRPSRGYCQRRHLLPTGLGLALLVLLLTTGAALAQTAAVLNGHVSPSQADSVLISWRVTPFDEHERNVAAVPDSRGNFQLRVPVGGPVLAQLSLGSHDTPVFLEPGDALRVQLQGDKADAEFRFQPADGSGHAAAATANNYLAQFTQRFVDDVEFQVLPDNIKLHEQAFLSFLDYRQKTEQKFLQSELGQGRVTPEFMAFAQAEINYATANDRLTYPELRTEALGTLPVPVSATYYAFLNDPALMSSLSGACLSPQYQDFGLNYIHRLVRQTGKPATDVCYYPVCYQTAGSRLQGPMRAAVQGLVALETIRFGHVAHADALLADYAAHGGAPAAWVAQLRSQQDAHRRCAIGSPAPPLPEGLRSLQGDTVQLRKCAGKLVYLLLWEPRKPASQREIRPLKDLMQRFASQPIEFVALALDNQEAAWRRLVATDPPLPGEQALVPSAAAVAALRQAYDVTALPAAVLLAEDGTILQLNARRPSHELLRADLQAAVGRAVAYRAVKLP